MKKFKRDKRVVVDYIYIYYVSNVRTFKTLIGFRSFVEGKIVTI